MRRLLTCILFVCVLNASLAWAWDGHQAVAPSGDDPVLVAAALPDLDAGGDACHYCSCGASHVLALPAADVPMTDGASSTAGGGIVSHFVSRASIPPIRPPRG